MECPCYIGKEQLDYQSKRSEDLDDENQ